MNRYITSYISNPDHGDDPSWLYIDAGFQCFNATFGLKSSYKTSYISNPNDGDDPICISKQGFSLVI